MKEIKFGKEAQKSLLKGIELANDVVRVTMGAGGKNVIMSSKGKSPIISKDGITASKSVESSDPFEQMGVSLIQDISNKTNEESGDGTSTSSVLGTAIAKEGLKYSSKRNNPIAIKRGIDKSTKMVIEELEKVAIDISSKEELVQIGVISSNGDEEIGNEIANALEKVGKEGVITVEDSKSFETHTTFLEGMSFDRGYISPFFTVVDKSLTPTFGTVTLEDAYILMTDSTISSMSSLMPILEQLVESGKPMLIITNEIEGDVLGGLITNLGNKAFNICVVKPPSFADNRKAMLEDIGVITNGKVLVGSLGANLEDLKLEDLGRSKKITITKDTTTIIEGAGSIEDIDTRIDQIKTLIDESTSDYVIEKLQERLAKLVGGVAILHVGAVSEVELKEKKDRVEDSLNAVRAAISEGIVIGGGSALAKIAKKLRDTTNLSGWRKEDKIGFKIVMKAIESPCKQIATNCGMNSKKVLKTIQNSDKNIGFDAKELEYCDMIERGILDPVKVTRVALESASSIAGLILTTEASVVNVEHTK